MILRLLGTQHIKWGGPWFFKFCDAMKCLIIFFILCLVLFPWPMDYFPSMLGLFLIWAAHDSRDSWDAVISFGIVFAGMLAGFGERPVLTRLVVGSAIAISIIVLRDPFQHEAVVSCLPWLAFFAAATVKKADRQLLSAVAMVLLSLQMLMSLFAYILNFEQYNTPDFGRRSCGMYNTPNAFYPLCMLSVISFLVMSRFKLTPKVFAVPLILLSSLNLVLTFSRAGWIGTSIGLATLLRIQKPYTNLGILFAVFALLVGAGCVRSHGQMVTTSNDRSASGRLIAWHNAVLMSYAHPWLGSGYGGYARQASLPEFTHARRATLADAKSLYLNTLVDTGIFGFIIYAAFFAFLAKICRTIMFSKNTFLVDQINAQIVTLSIAALLAAGIFDTSLFGPFFNFPVTCVFLIFSGFVVSCVSDVTKKNYEVGCKV